MRPRHDSHSDIAVISTAVRVPVLSEHTTLAPDHNYNHAAEPIDCAATRYYHAHMRTPVIEWRMGNDKQWTGGAGKRKRPRLRVSGMPLLVTRHSGNLHQLV